METGTNYTNIPEDYPSYLQEFKDHCHVAHNNDDANFLKWIPQAHAKIQSHCGKFPMENLEGIILVKEYVRYLREGVVAFFYEDFKEDMTALSWSLYDPPETEVTVYDDGSYSFFNNGLFDNIPRGEVTVKPIPHQAHTDGLITPIEKQEQGKVTEVSIAEIKGDEKR